VISAARSHSTPYAKAHEQGVNEREATGMSEARSQWTQWEQKAHAHVRKHEGAHA